MSGDGLVHEAINSLLSRSDFVFLSSVQLGVLPGGSSNALVFNLNQEANLKFGIKSSAFQILRNKSKKIGLLKMHLDQTQVYSFLSVSCGVIAEIDLKSEFMRSLGEIRYDLYALWVLLKNPKF